MDITGIDSFIRECSKSSNLSDFKHTTYDLLVKILQSSAFNSLLAVYGRLILYRNNSFSIIL